MTDPITDYFDSIANDRNKLMAQNAVVEYEQEKRSEGVVSLLDPQAGELILDIGCGNARDIIPVLKNGSRVIGIDLSPCMISEARRELSTYPLDGYELEVGDAINLRFHDAYFDKVIASEVVEHIPNWDKALSEIWRVLKKQGCLVLSTPNRKSWYGFDRYIVYEKIFRKKWGHPYDQWKTYSELETALTSSGFSVVEKRGICYMPGFIIPYFVLPRALKRSLVWLVRKLEKRLSHSLPMNGYTLCVKAIKN